MRDGKTRKIQNLDDCRHDVETVAVMASDKMAARQSCRSQHIIQYEYTIAEIGFDTAGNGPSKISTLGDQPIPDPRPLRVK